MKITSLLVGCCLLCVLTGCHKSQPNKPQTNEVIGAAEATIKSISLASITEKYPDVSSSDLVFHDLRIGTMPDGKKEDISVTYDLPASAKTTTEGKVVSTITKTIIVGMILSGTPNNVYESTRTINYSKP